MSSSREFIISRLDEIIRELPDIQLRYEHREIHGEHIIEVSPKYYYEDGSRFEPYEIALYQKFLELFPDETILVIPPDDMIKINSATYTACTINTNWVFYNRARQQCFDVSPKFNETQVVAEKKFNYAKAA
jgi:hypothetical protein